MLWHVMGANPQVTGILQSHRRGAIICPHAVHNTPFPMAGLALALLPRRSKKSRFAEKKLRLLQTGQYRVRRPVGELPF